MRGQRGSAWLIAAAALLPLVLFLIFQIGYSAREQRRSIEARALSRSEAVILAADTRVARISAALDALATASSIRSGNLAEFEGRVRDLARLSDDWRGFQLIDPASGKTLLSIGASPIRIVNGERVVSRDRTAFTGFAMDSTCRCLMFERRSTSRGRPVKLRALISADPFLRLLPSIHSEYPVSAIVGPKGLFIARTVSPGERFGNLGSDYLVGAVKSGKRQGIYRGFTLEGLENYTAFTRSDQTGWSAHIALGSEYIDMPARRYLASLGFAILVSLLLAVLLILYALRQLAEWRRLGERMEQSQKLEALGQLTGGIAHDFNNLLTPIVGSLELISKRPELDARARRLAEAGLASAVRAAKLTKQLLAFSRRQKLSLEAIDLCAMLDELTPILVQSASGGVKLAVDTPGVPCWVKTDSTQLELALINLVLNARDAAPPGSTIDIGVSQVEIDGRAFCRLRVADQGPGMTAEIKRRAFEPFFTTKPQGKGTGLGLAQVYALALQSEGSTTIDSAPGEGTRIDLNLPSCDPPVSSDEPSQAEQAELRPVRILVAEDEEDVRAMLVAALEEDGHRIVQAADGAAALDLLDQGFELLVADFAMPGMTGAELIGIARERYPELRFLIVTGYLDSAEVEAAAPGTPIMTKPFDFDALRQMVRDVVAGTARS